MIFCYSIKSVVQVDFDLQGLHGLEGREAIYRNVLLGVALYN